MLGIFGTARAGIKEVVYQTCTRVADSVDQQLDDNQAKYTFRFIELDGSKNRMIYSIDGVEGKAKLENNSIEFLTTPGKHIFQFYYSENFEEVYTDSLEILDRHHSTYEIHMMSNYNGHFTIDKPVIYLYPEEKSAISVQMDIKGEPIFYYPKYEDQWEFEAQPNGDLIFGDHTYNYLFWEASQGRSFSENELKSGFNVQKEDVVRFLEEKLTLAGLNSKEQADFITYWGPRLSANEWNFVRFEFNETCNRYAEMNISPKPTNVYRVYITWMPIEAELNVAPQEIETIHREGFTVLEWGGIEIEQIPATSLLLN
jgi:hypothetical protein